MIEILDNRKRGFKFNKLRLFFSFVVSIPFLLIFIFISWASILNMAIPVFIIFSFLSYRLIYLLLKICSFTINGNHAIKLDDKGFIDNSNLFKTFNYSWLEIKNIKLKRFFGKTFIIIYLIDLDSKISEFPFFFRFTSYFNKIILGSPFFITGDFIKENTTEIHNALITHLQLKQLSK